MRAPLASLLLLAACSGPSPKTLDDTAPDSGTDSGADSGTDSGTDSSDSGAETGDDSAGETADTWGPPGDPSLVFFNYVAGDDPLVTGVFDLQVERRDDGLLYLRDQGSAGYTSWYALNGATRRGDARGLPEGPVDNGRWLHVVKFVADVSNLNTDGWRTSSQYTGGHGTRYAAAYEATFYVHDGSRPAEAPHTEPLWTDTPVTDGLIFGATPPFSLVGKTYGSESTPRDEDPSALADVGWNLADDRFRLLYAGDVYDLIAALGLSAPNGITSADDATLDRAADWLAARTPAALFAVDYEPANPAADAWMWDYDDARFAATMRALSDRLWERHGRLFYSWIGSGTGFTHRGASMRIDGFSSGNWDIGGVDAWLAVHEDPGAIAAIDRPSDHLVQVGFGYTSATINAGDPAAGPEVWKAPVAWYLRALDVLNLQTLLADEERFLLFLWPYEDQPSDAKRTPMSWFPLPGWAGTMRQVDNRVAYPPNLVRDGIVTMLANPRVVYTNYWIFGESYDPLQSLNYSRINGVQSCLAAGLGDFHVYAYEGPDTPTCPSSGDLYMGKDVLQVAAMVQAHEVFARHLSDVLDGSQERAALDTAPRYTRRDGVEHTASWAADTGEFVRSWKFSQPWVQVWRNPGTGQHVALVQDPFAEPFEPVSVRLTVGGTERVAELNGNELTWVRW